MVNSINTSDLEERKTQIIPIGLQALVGIIISVLIILAVMGNLLVIVSFIKDKQLQTVYNVYIISLAVCDLFIGGVSMPFYARYTLNNWVWEFGSTFCVAWSVVDYGFCLEVIFLTILLSLDRVLLVTNGVRYFTRESKCVAGAKIAISFVVSFGTYVSCIVGWKYWRGYSIVDYMDCDVEFYDSFYFSIAIAIFELTLPFVALSVLNFILFWRIRKRLKEQDHSTVIRERTHRTGNARIQGRDSLIRVGADDITRRNNAQTIVSLYEVQRSVRRDKRVAKSLSILVVAFVITWGPYTITQVVKNVCGNCVNTNLDECFVWLLWSKSAINPFLYALQNDRYKSNIFSFIPCLRVFFKRNNQVANGERM